jgi:hypothetical protein
MAANVLNISFVDEFPDSLKASAEKCLREGIAFLEGIPRPTASDGEWLTPNFPELKFTFGENVWSHGLFSRESMAGFCVMDYRSNRELLINSKPCMTFLNVDAEICTVASVVFVLDQYFVKDKKPEQHLMRQLQYLDSIAAKNKSIKSIVDDYEQAQKDQAEVERQAAYKNQFVEKHRLQREQLRNSRYIRTPSWYWSKNPDAIVSQHEAPATEPPKPHYCKHEPQPPCPPLPPAQPAPTPTLSAEDAKAMEIIKGHQQYMQSFCATEDFDK